MRQLSLDYFSDRIQQVKRDIESGSHDPLSPLGDFIEMFEKLPGDRVQSLPRFLDLFSGLFGLFSSKVEAFKARLQELDLDGLERLARQQGAIDSIARALKWRVPFELVRCSASFLETVVAHLSRVVRTFPACQVEEGPGVDQVPCFDLHTDGPLFSQEKERVMDLVLENSRGRSPTQPTILGTSPSIPLPVLLDKIQEALSVERVLAFILVLHLVQDGMLALIPWNGDEIHGEDGETIENEGKQVETSGSGDMLVGLASWPLSRRGVIPSEGEQDSL